MGRLFFGFTLGVLLIGASSWCTEDLYQKWLGEGNPCAWKEHMEEVRSDIRSELLADLTNENASEVFFGIMTTAMLFQDVFGTRWGVDSYYWKCFQEFHAMIITEMRSLGGERQIDIWERGFVGFGVYFDSDDSPICQTFIFLGIWLKESVIPSLENFTVLKLRILNTTDNPISFSPDARVLLVDQNGVQHLPYTAFDVEMLSLIDKPFYRHLWGIQTTIYPDQALEVYLPYDKVEVPKRLIFEHFEGLQSKPFFLDLFFSKPEQ